MQQTSADRKIEHLFPQFARRIERVLKDMKHYAAKHMIEHQWIIVEGYRTAKYQNELYQKGRTKPGSIVTFKDGYKKKSNHQSAMAVDIAPKRGPKIDWNVPLKHWEYLGHVIRKHGLDWGGDWEKFIDKPHAEWPVEDVAAYHAARKWLKEQDFA